LNLLLDEGVLFNQEGDRRWLASRGRRANPACETKRLRITTPTDPPYLAGNKDRGFFSASQEKNCELFTAREAKLDLLRDDRDD
jgi:hypothetical protein